MDILPSSWSNIPTMKVCYCQIQQYLCAKGKISSYQRKQWRYATVNTAIFVSKGKKSPYQRKQASTVQVIWIKCCYQYTTSRISTTNLFNHAVEAGSYGQHSFCRDVGYAFNIVETVSMYLYSTFWIFFCIVFSIFVLWHYLIVKCLFCYIYCLDCHFKAVYICMSGDISWFWLSCLGSLCALYLISTLSLKTYLFLFTCMIL